MLFVNKESKYRNIYNFETSKYLEYLKNQFKN